MNHTDQPYHFDLPEELIAQEPAARRADSRLLLTEPDRGLIGERIFRDLPDLLQPGDLLVVNESRVLPARLWTTREETGGRVEILLVRPTAAGPWLAMARPARRLRAGTRLRLAGGEDRLEVVDKLPDGRVLVTAAGDIAELAGRWGEMPVPPYIRRAASEPEQAERKRIDLERYQTVYAETEAAGAGSVAAPTAGLHFSDAVLARLAERGVDLARLTLHVGPGTFQPPTGEQIAARRLHREFFRLPAAVSVRLTETRRRGGRVIAVGTTSLRVLETVARLDLPEQPDHVREYAATDEDPAPVFTGRAEPRNGAWRIDGSTRLFIRPPDRARAADGLLTNFHLPGSSLLMLVASLLGERAWREVYATAVERRLRFYSYGDCMLILPGLADVAGPAREVTR